MYLPIQLTLPGTVEPRSPPIPNATSNEVYISTDFLAPKTSTATPYGKANITPRPIPAPGNCKITDNLHGGKVMCYIFTISFLGETAVQ